MRARGEPDARVGARPRAGAAPSSPGPSATSSCGPAWPAWPSSTSATRPCASGGSTGCRPTARAGRARVVPHRPAGRVRRGPRAPRRRLAGPGGRALLPGHRASTRRGWPAGVTWPCRAARWSASRTSTSPGPAARRARGRSPHAGSAGRAALDGGRWPWAAPAPCWPPSGRPGPATWATSWPPSSASRTRSSASPLAGVLMVQGGPGTGKTAVALHRAAYLLYTHRFPLERQGVLVVGPNPLFLRYIEQVLPSLGETGVTLSTVSGLVPEVRVRASDPPDGGPAEGRGPHGPGDRPGRAHPPARPAPRRGGPLRGRRRCGSPSADSAEIVAQARRRPGTHNARRRFVEQQVVRRLADQYERVQRGFGARRTAPAVEGDRSRLGGRRGGGRRRVGPRPGRARPPAPPRRRRWPRRSTGCGPASPPTSCSTTCSVPGRSWRRPARAILSAGRAGHCCTGPAAPPSTRWRGRPADAALVDEARTVLGPRRTRGGCARGPTAASAPSGPARRSGSGRRGSTPTRPPVGAPAPSERRGPRLRPHRRRRGAGPLAAAAAHAGPAVALGLDDRGGRHRPGHRALGARRAGTRWPRT